MLLRWATSVERLVHRLVRDLDAEALGTLHLDLLHHEPLEHLLAEDVARRQLLAGLLDAVGNHPHLLVEFAAQHDAVVGDRGDAVERLAARAQFGALRRGGAGEQDEAKETLGNQ